MQNRQRTYGASALFYTMGWRKNMIENNNAISSANEILARQINQQARRDLQSPYAGKLVGIANGQVVVVANTWREVADRLREVEPDPSRCRCIEASADYDRVEEIWGVA
jgi:hypothetical protein